MRDNVIRMAYVSEHLEEGKNIMKKVFAIIMCLILLCLSACGVSRDTYEDALEDAAEYSREIDDLKAENAALKQELAEAEEKYKALEKEYNELNAGRSSTVKETEAAQKNVYVTTDRVRVRATPSTEDANNIVATLDPGKEVVFVRDESEEWAVVEINGEEVYVSRQYIAPKQ